MNGELFNKLHFKRINTNKAVSIKSRMMIGELRQEENFKSK